MIAVCITMRAKKWLYLILPQAVNPPVLYSATTFYIRGIAIALRLPLKNVAKIDIHKNIRTLKMYRWKCDYDKKG